MATSSSGISFGGLFSGLDTESIITKLMTLEKQPVKLLEKQKASLGYKQDGIKDVNNNLLSLQTSLKPLLDDIAAQKAATTSDKTVVQVSADVSASVSSYTVDVIQKAYAHRVAADTPQATGYTVAGAQSFDLTVGGTAFTINLAGGETLTQVAQKINTATNAGVTFLDKAEAFVVTDPLTNDQTMVIESKTTGTTNAISVWDTSGWLSSVGLANGAVWNNELQLAQDAQIKIDGITVNSSTNTFANAIAGVTFIAQKVGTAEVTIGSDDDAIVAQVKEFVDKFNAATDLINKYTLEQPVSKAVTEEDMKKGVLRGDIDLSNIKGDIRMRTTGYTNGTAGLTYHVLSELGIDSEASSGSVVSDKITLDENKLRAALATNRTDVSTVLNDFSQQMTDYLDGQTKVSSVQSMAGGFYQRVLSIDDNVANIDLNIKNWTDRLAMEEERLRTSFMNMETLLQQMQSQGTYLSNSLNGMKSSSSSSKG